MKKRALKKDFDMEIRKSLNRFLSILLINALGVAFFAGVRAAEPDMQLSADAFYDESNLMDIRVLGTLGVTEGDLEAIAAVDGVKEIMAFYSVDMFCTLPEEQLNIQLMSVPDTMNRIQVKDGRMPEAEDECLVDYKLIEEGHLRIGDTLTMKSGTDDATEDLIHQDTFTVVGAGSTSLFLSLERGTTSIGSGTLDGFLVVQPSVFAVDYYTQICVTAEGALELTCYTDEYDDHVDALVERIEELEEERCDIRYAQIQEEGQEKIAEAEADVAEGEQELADAGEELADARRQLEDARAELEDGQAELLDGERKVADAGKELLDGKQEIADGWAELNKAREELVMATFQYEKGYSKYREGKEEIDAGYAQLQQLKDAQSGLQTIVTMLEGAKQQHQALVDKSLAGETLTAEEQQTMAALSYQIPILEGERDGVKGKLSSVLPNRGQDDQTYLKQLSAAIASIQAPLDEGAGELAEAKAQLDAALKQIGNGNLEADEAEQELREAEAELADGEAELAEAQAELADARQTLADAEKEFADAEEELLDGEQEYEEARIESEEKIADAKAEIADAKKELAELEHPEWYVLDRQYIQTYVEYGDDAARIGAIGELFPVIFFLVAALVSLTTMTRMVEEERT